MAYDFNEHRSGSYKEPFSQTQYGVFTISAVDGKVKFISTGVMRDDALLKAHEYYESTDADKSEVEHFFVRTRPVTYGLWEDE